MKQPTIKTKKFILRPLKKSDAVSLAEFANNKNISRFLNERFPYPYTLSDAEKFIEISNKFIKNKNPRSINFGIEIDKHIVGIISIGLNLNQRMAELGYWLGEPYWGNGVMTGAVNEIVKYSFNTLKLHRIQARVMEINAPSMALLKKNKFKQEGFLHKALFKNGKFYNLYFFARVK